MRPPALLLTCCLSLLGNACSRSDAGRPETRPPPTPPARSAAAPAAAPSALPTTLERPATPLAGAAPATAQLASVPAAAPASQPSGPRVYAKTRFVWIRPEPDASKQWVGYLWTGESAKLKSDKPVYGPGCMYWYAVEPLGFVCVDGLRATLDPNDPGFVAARRYAADLGSAWPHQYGEAQSLTRLLTLEGSPLSFPGLPNSVRDGRVKLRRGSTVAYSSELRVGADEFLLGSDLSYVPKSRVTPFPRYEFRGIELGAESKLPLALFRGKDRPKFKKTAAGLEATEQSFPRLSHAALSGKSEEHAGERYLETADGWFVRASDAVVPTPSVRPPWGDATPKGRATWIEVSVTQGWLIAYEANQPVFTTLISAGRGGPAQPNEDPIEQARTPLGAFPVSGKFATATMEAPGDLIHTAVPWTQNFSGPHALHSAYWHDDWGNYKSGGCINVSPTDGKKLFEWSEPSLPEGWHGVRWLPWRGPATILIVHR